MTTAPFGRLITAMVTPFKADLSVDWAGVEKLATHLVSTGHDAIVVSGTTGEAPTTNDDEKDELIRVVKATVGSKVKVIAGAGNNETPHSVEQAIHAQKVGADGLLVVTPYYNKPPQAGIEAHFRAIADAVDLPVMMYDIPGRTGVEIETETICRLAEHPKISALKDAKSPQEKIITTVETLKKLLAQCDDKEAQAAWIVAEFAAVHRTLAEARENAAATCGGDGI